MSAADPTYPDVVRGVLTHLQVGAISDPVVLETGYAVLKLERKIPAQLVRLVDVKPALQLRVRRDMERMLMDRLVRTMVQQADVVVMSPALQVGWTREKQKIVEGH
jgi:parvulin-like peptidyl-prolyl isomerase